MRTGWCVMLAVLAVASGESLYEVLQQRPEFSEFFGLVNSVKLISMALKGAEFTLFAPTNDAMQKFEGVRNADFIKYHMMNRAMTSDQLRNTAFGSSHMKGNPKLFFTVQKRQDGEDDIFINDARLISRDLESTLKDGTRQYLHVIDEALEPTICPNESDSNCYNPSALNLLNSAAAFGTRKSTIRKFSQKVAQLEKTDVFDTTGFHTYFIPVDMGMQGAEDDVDTVVVDAHMIPKKVLFTRTMGNDSYETMAFGDVPKVTAQLRVRSHPEEEGGSLYEIQSHTLLGDGEHVTGSVLAKIVKPNIVVSNGVVHLIERPLVVIEKSAFDFIERGSKDQFLEFFNLLQNYDPEFLDMLRRRKNGTIFVPSNDAFYTVDQERLAEIKLSPERLRDLLNLHLIADRVTILDVRKAPKTPLYNVPSEDPSRSLYLSVWGTAGKNQTMTVEGGGTNATVITADIVAKDGVIHVIDKLLGVPYRSVGEKLAVDPMMSDTNILATQTKFSRGVRDMGQKFTMFVPSNDAWKNVSLQYPTSHKSLFEGRASHPANTILERHFLIGEALSMDELVNKSKEGDDGVKFYKTSFDVEEKPEMSGYLVKWEGMVAQVTRSNVECTNGYIHVIDTVFMRQRDVITTSSAAALAGSVGFLAMALAALRL